MTLSIDAIRKQLEAEREAAAETAMDERGALALKLYMAKVGDVMISFYGSGDDGSIEDIDITMRDPAVPTPEWARKELEDWGYKFLEGTGIDWVNNDGGQGHLHWDLSIWPGKFDYKVEYNETVAHVGAEGEEFL